MKNVRITFIGAGNMAKSLIGGLIANDISPDSITASCPTQKNLAELATAFNINVTNNNLEAIKHADVIIFAVKPHVMPVVTQELASVIHAKPYLLVSIAAGITTSLIEKWIHTQAAIVRCMPNTPALVRSGATALFANIAVTEEQKSLAESIMRAVGITLWLDQESAMDTVTALSGSGPAYFFLVMEHLEQAAIEQGLAADVAHLLTLQTVLGTARIALESNESIATLREHVTSKGGTTEAALSVLFEKQVSEAFHAALKAAEQRAKQLAESHE